MAALPHSTMPFIMLDMVAEFGTQKIRLAHVQHSLSAHSEGRNAFYLHRCRRIQVDTVEGCTPEEGRERYLKIKTGRDFRGYIGAIGIGNSVTVLVTDCNQTGAHHKIG